MKTFTYYSNKESWHGEKLAEIVAADILAADKIFQEQTKINPFVGWVGCEISVDSPQEKD